MGKWENNGYTISTEKQFLDVATIHRFLSGESYWAQGISLQQVQKAIDHSSLCFGIYEGNPVEGDYRQAGFARVITDFVRFGWIMDVFVLSRYRGKGLSKWLIEVMTEQTELKSVGKLMLATEDAHGLYSQYGFEVLQDPEHYMKRMNFV